MPPRTNQRCGTDPQDESRYEDRHNQLAKPDRLAIVDPEFAVGDIITDYATFRKLPDNWTIVDDREEPYRMNFVLRSDEGFFNLRGPFTVLKQPGVAVPPTRNDQARYLIERLQARVERLETELRRYRAS